MRGTSKFPPLWAIVLEAAGNDPLRAQEIEDSVTQEWWDRYLTYRTAKAQAESKKRK